MSTPQRMTRDRYEALAMKMDAISRDWEGNPVRSGCYSHAAQIIRANAPKPAPESSVATTPTVGAVRAERAILSDTFFPSTGAFAAIIDRATGLPALVETCRELADTSDADTKTLAHWNLREQARVALAKHDEASGDRPVKCFDGMTRKPGHTASTYKLPEITGELIVVCPVCDGYGGWKMRNGPRTEVFCDQCHGWGWVDRNGPDHRCPEHRWETWYVRKNVHRWECTQCHHKRLVDSSG